MTSGKKKMLLSDNAISVISERYANEDEDWEKISNRVGTANSLAELPDKRKEYAEKFSEMVYYQDFISAGRILRNSGRPRGSLFNCFFVPIFDSIEEIGKYNMDSLILWSEQGGVGTNFSFLRPKGDMILGKGGHSSGLISFLKASDCLSETIESGGGRRAAGMAICDISHPEVVSFINCKKVDKIISHYNLSVAINGSFLTAVERGDDWEFKFKQRSYGKIPSEQLWNLIIHNMIYHGEPGIVNWDNLYKNNSYYYDPVMGLNPCITGDTLVYVADGRSNVSIKQLSEEGKDVPVFSYNEEKKKIEVKIMRHPRKTGINQKILKIILDDGSFVKCTENHKFYLNNGEVKQAKDLKENDGLIRLLKKGFRRENIFNHKNSSHNNSYEINIDSSYEIEEYKKYLELKKNTDLNIFYSNGIFVKKECEYCGTIFITSWDLRECAYCSSECIDNSSKKLKGTSTNYSPVPEIYLNYKIVKIEECGYEDVYNGTVDDNHNFFIFTKDNSNITDKKYESNYILTCNCGEATLSAYEACDLGSINLPNFITGSINTNWKKLETTIKLAVRFLDNVIDINKYPIKEIDIKCHNSRRIGLGVMGLAEYLFAKQIKYGSQESLNEIEKLMRFIRDAAYIASIELSVEKGCFPKFDPIHYGKASFVRSLPPSLRMEIKEKGVRNVTLMSFAPTGSISLITANNSTGGIEPLPAKAYLRNDRIGKRMYVHPRYKEFLDKNEELPDWYVDSYDLKIKDHFEVQRIVQQYVDGAVSKTINLPKGTEESELSKLLLEYSKDLKGTTVYTDGSREDQPINKVSKEEVLEYLKNEKVTTELTEDDLQCTSGACEWKKG